MKKRILSIILVILLCLNLISFSMAASDENASVHSSTTVSAEKEPPGKEKTPASPSEAAPLEKEEKKEKDEAAEKEKEETAEKETTEKESAEKESAEKETIEKETIEKETSEKEKKVTVEKEKDEEEDLSAEPYYLFLIHFLAIDDKQYASSELVELEPGDLQDSAYDLHQNILEKEGMKAVSASLFRDEDGGLEESWTVSPEDFTQGGDPEDGSAYYAVQAMIEYSAADGYKAVISEEAGAFEDPYGIMPLENFQGGNIGDISFVPADVITVAINYAYDPNDGFSDMTPAAGRTYQLEIDEAARASGIEEIWDMPAAKDGFRIVLDVKPLDSFPAEDIYFDSVGTENPDYGNLYSTDYNRAWEQARKIIANDYTAEVISAVRTEGHGADPLAKPKLKVNLTADQCVSGKSIHITVYYRRADNLYDVVHWVPAENLSDTERNHFIQDLDGFNKAGQEPFDNGYIAVYWESIWGRESDLTKAVPNPRGEGVPSVLSYFAADEFNQKEIGPDTRVDIFYSAAQRYRLIFNTDETYIARQHVEFGNDIYFSNGEMSIVRGGTETRITAYGEPTRQGYDFAGWKYKVRNPGDGDDSLKEQDENADMNYYQRVPFHKDTGREPWHIDNDVYKKAVWTGDATGGNELVIDLYPIWEPAKASVRVVFWTEDLSGGAKDVDVDVDDTPGGADYRARVNSYLNGTPNTVGTRFSNAGSFTFMARTGQELDLSVADKTISSSVTDTFSSTDEVDDVKDQLLPALINQMFKIKMPKVQVSTGDMETAPFYYPLRAEYAKYTVAPDGSTVINLYYARNVYKLDFVYYGKITQASGTNYDGPDGLAVATNTIGYSVRNKEEGFQYDYQNPNPKTKEEKNRWQLVKVTGENNETIIPKWTVPQTLSISAKYDADIRSVWPLAQGEQIDLTLVNENNNMKNVAVFMSWGATAGPFNQNYRNGKTNESTIIGNYRSMSADIIADPNKPETVHILVGYWWNEYQSYYRRNACFEVPGLTEEILCSAADVKKFDLTKRKLVYAHIKKEKEDQFDVVPMAVKEPEITRRNTLYLVPVGETSSLYNRYFKDYADEFIVVNAQGKPAGPNETDRYYAARWINTTDGGPKVYALGRQAVSVSTNYIKAQAPSSMPAMTSVSFNYDLTYTWENDRIVEQEVSVDHDTQTWDDWGRTANGLTPESKFMAVGTIDDPYDIWFYYDRETFTIHYIVAARESTSGEYEIGTQKMIYGEPLSKYNYRLDPKDEKLYSDNEKFQQRWIPTNNNSVAPKDSEGKIRSSSLNSKNHTRLAPDSAEDGKGAWTLYCWSLDRSSKDDMGWPEGRVTGNMRVYAQWTPPAYRVKFDLNGGSCDGNKEFDIQTVKANQGYTSSGNPIPRPVWDGHTLEGWTWYTAKEEASTEGDLTANVADDSFNFERPIIQNMVVKANWSSVPEETYNYKIWYLTDEADAGSPEQPEGLSGQWLSPDQWGELGADANRPDGNFTHILGCQYFGKQDCSAGADLFLTAASIGGYIPIKASTTLTLDKNKNGTGAADTENVAFFYYTKSHIKTYQIRFQPFDKTGEDGILYTSEKTAADGVYLTPSEADVQKLKNMGYQLVLMDASGNAILENGQPQAARSYLELTDFIDRENTRFANLATDQNAVVTFKVMPIPYTIAYRVGTLVNGTGREALRAAMQELLDRLSGSDVGTAVNAGKNPTRYMVSDFDDIVPSFTLKNPSVVKNPENSSEEWRFTGWSPAPGTTVISPSRTVTGEYPTLEIERSVGDLEFLANWEMVTPEDPTVPNQPGNSGHHGGGGSHSDNPNPPAPPDTTAPPAVPNQPADPNLPVVPVQPADPNQPTDLNQQANPDRPTELPDPNDPSSPELITIWEEGVPKHYRKVWNPERGEWEYIPEDDIPLTGLGLPKTGDTSAPWGLINILSLFGLIMLRCMTRLTKKKRR